MSAVISTVGLVKRYGRLRAVDGIDLDVQAGDVYGFLGANGSGKTTTVRMLLGLVLPTSGTIELLGERMPRAGRRVLPRVGALIEGPAHYGHLSGRENLSLLDASGRGGSWRTRSRRVAEALDQVGLSGVGRRPVKAYSLGMRQRLGLAGALLRRPELLVLDEPTNGLDPQGISEIRELLLDLHRGGTTVFLSSHLLAEVEQLCSRVGVLDRGRLVLQDRLATLTAPTGSTVVHTPDPHRVRATLDGRVTSIDGERVIVRGGDPAEVNARLVTAGIPVHGLALERPTLEEVVLAAAGRRHRPGGPMIVVELRKMFRRPRTWATIAVLNALPILVAVLLVLTDLAPRPGEGPPFLSAVLSNGALYPLAALAIVLPLFLPIAVAVVAGDAIAGEAQAGTLRYLLARPAGRTRLLVAKLAAVLAFVFVTVLVVAGVGYLVGTTLFDAQPVAGTSVSGTSLTPEEIGGRTALAIGYVALSMLGVAAFALFFSTLTDSPLGATMGALAVLVASSLLFTLDAASPIAPYLPTRYWLAFVDFFRDPILWRDVVRGIALQGVYVGVLLAAAWANFTTKDITS